MHYPPGPPGPDAARPAAAEGRAGEWPRHLPAHRHHSHGPQQVHTTMDWEVLVKYGTCRHTRPLREGGPSGGQEAPRCPAGSWEGCPTSTTGLSQYRWGTDTTCQSPHSSLQEYIAPLIFTVTLTAIDCSTQAELPAGHYMVVPATYFEDIEGEFFLR